VDRAWDAYDPATAVAPRGLFCPSGPSDESVAELSKKGEELPFECVPVALYDRVSFFIKVRAYCRSLRKAWAP
jgi:hypothetical protein